MLAQSVPARNRFGMTQNTVQRTDDSADRADAMPTAQRVRRLLDHEWRLLIGGELVPARDGRTFADESPYTREVIAQVPDGSAADADAAAEAAEAARAAWRATTALERADHVYRLADLIEQHKEDFAALEAIDGGSPIVNTRFDVDTALQQMRMFAGLALEMKGESIPASHNLHFTVREPVGVAVKIFPYNHPLMFACRAAAPLIAGNPTIIKPPEAAPLSPLLLGELAREVFPPGVFNVVVGNGTAVPDRLVRHPAARRIGFIGSGPTGRAIQRAAAESGVKHVTLELGGKNAMVVFPDADLDKAAAGAVFGMNFTWSGQSCGSNSRLLVHRSIHDDLVRRVVTLIEQRRIANPLSDTSEQGTMINQAQYDKSLDYLRTAAEQGATVQTGGGPAQDVLDLPADAELGDGLFVAPTVLTGVTPQSRIGQEEVFGPVLSVIPFDDEAEAIEIANGVELGLTGSVWTADVTRAHRVALALEAGYTWINGSSYHFPNVPYGGVKGSGVGGKEECLEELLSYTDAKVINVML